MKTLVALALFGTLLSLVSCGPTLEQVINRVAPQILENGVNKGVLSAGGYYLHHIIKASNSPQKLHTLNLHIRGLNNQTRIDLKATVDDKFTIKTWYYNYSIIKDTRGLGEGLGFAWLNYAASSTSEFCSNIGNYEEARDLVKRGQPYLNLPDNNLKVKSSFKDIYDLGLEKHGNLLSPVDGFWKNPRFISPAELRFEDDSYILVYIMKQDTNGDQVRYLRISSVYQPCSGALYSYPALAENTYLED